MNGKRKYSKVFSTAHRSKFDNLASSYGSDSDDRYCDDDDRGSDIDNNRKDSLISIRKVSILSTLKDRLFNMLSSKVISDAMPGTFRFS